MIKRILGLLLALTFILIPSISSHASDNLKLESFNYYNSQGEEIKELTGGETITVKSKVIRGKNLPESAILITQVYKDGVVTDIISDPYTFQSENEERELKTLYTLPSNTDGIKIKSFIWDSFKNMNSLLNPSVFKSDNAKIEDIFIYGAKLENFNPDKKEYDVVLPASASDKPELEYIAEDIGTNVELQHENGKIILNTKSHGGTEEEYIINYTKEPFAVTDISLTNTADSSVIYNGGIRADFLKYPQYDLDENNNPKPTVFGADIFNRATRVFADKYHIYLDFPEEMEGAKIIETKRGIHSGSTSLNYKIKFTLNKTATLYFNTTTSCVPTGAVKLDKQINYIEKNSYADATGTAYDPDTAGNVSKNIWKIKCEVPEGKESETFEINLATTTYSGPLLFIKE